MHLSFAQAPSSSRNKKKTSDVYIHWKSESQTKRKDVVAFFFSSITISSIFLGLLHLCKFSRHSRLFSTHAVRVALDSEEEKKVKLSVENGERMERDGRK